MLIEVAAAMIAELFPWRRDFEAPALLFNELMRNRCKKIVNFLKMHYCLSRREEDFWRDNRRPETIPEELRTLLAAWRHRPPCRFDFVADHETFPYFSYQYVLYGMEHRTILEPARSRYGRPASVQRAFAQIRSLALRAAQDLPTHRCLIDEVYRDGFRSPVRRGGAGQRGMRVGEIRR